MPPPRSHPPLAPPYSGAACSHGGHPWWWCVVVVVVRTMCYARMSVHARTRMHPIKTDQSQCTGPFGWTDQLKPRYACSLRKQVPGVPSAKSPNPKARKKKLRGTPTSPPLLWRKGERNLFRLLGAGCPGSGMIMRRCIRTCLPG